MTTTTTVSRQKVHAVLKKAGFRRSEWLRSGRVKGWGNSTTGYELEAEHTTEYRCARCGGKFHETWCLQQRYKARWRERKIFTGRLFIDWRNGDWSHDHKDRATQLTAIQQTLAEAGITAVADEKHGLVIG
jgi:hypothetical protein